MAVSVLRLEYDESAVPPGGISVVSSPGLPVKLVGKDAAGHVFHEMALRQAGLLDEPEDCTDANEGSADDTTSDAAEVDYGEPEGPWKSKGKKKKKKKGEDREDLYALVGLKNERWTASENQIKNSYRKVALEMHPDKRGAATAEPEKKQEIEDHFKKIQEAYETLMDPTKRREYDSVDDFDDSLPSECTPKDFFKVFGPAFLRQSRWAERKPVPSMGEPDTPYAEVDKFYDYWFTFKSWREFPHPDEEDIEQAENRDHKRWIDRENKKLRQAGKKEEFKRLKEFVENAFSCDPRVIKHKEEEKAERERKRKEKGQQRAQRAAEEERKKQEEEERKAAEEKEAAAAKETAKKEREKERKALQKERKRLRTNSGNFPEVDSDDIEKICSSLTLPDMKQLNTELEEEGAEGAALVSKQMYLLDNEAAAKEEAKEAARAAELQEKQRREAEKHAACMNDWTEEETRMLEKALNKFPQGTTKRWEQVTNYVRTRSQPEVIQMVKVRLAAGAGIPDRGQESFKVPEKRQQNRIIKDEATHRLTSFSDVEVNIKGEAKDALLKDAEALLKKTAEPKVAAQNGEDKAAPKAEATPTKPAPAAAPAPAAKKEATPAPVAKEEATPAPAAKKEVVVEAKKESAPAVKKEPASEVKKEPASEPAPPATPPATDATVADVPAWSETQELALVKALKTFGKELGQERWVRIAEAVPGKTKVECFKHFKELREGFRAKKAP